MKKTLLLSLTIFCCFFSACAALSGSDSLDLSGTNWELVSYAGQTPIAGRAMTIEFDRNDIRGTTGCNSYFGSYRLKDGQITIGDLGWTEMACMDPEGIMDQEQQVMRILSEAATISRDGSELRIRAAGGEILIFRPAAE